MVDLGLRIIDDSFCSGYGVLTGPRSIIKVIKQKHHPVLYMSLAKAYEQQGKFDEAIAAYQKFA